MTFPSNSSSKSSFLALKLLCLLTKNGHFFLLSSSTSAKTKKSLSIFSSSFARAAAAASRTRLGVYSDHAVGYTSDNADRGSVCTQMSTCFCGISRFKLTIRVLK